MKKWLLLSTCLLVTFPSFAQKKQIVEQIVKGPKVPPISVKPPVVPRVSIKSFNPTIVPSHTYNPKFTRGILPKRESTTLRTNLSERINYGQLEFTLKNLGPLSSKEIVIRTNPKTKEKYFSLDKVYWSKADPVMAQAVQNGHFVHFMEDGSWHYSPYKGGPEFEFYDKKLFKELNRSKELGLSVVETEGYVAVQWPADLLETPFVWSAPTFAEEVVLKDISPYSFVSHTHVQWLRNEAGKVISERYIPLDESVGGLGFAKVEGGVAGSLKADARSLREMNDWFASFKELAAKIQPYRQYHIRIVYDSPAKKFLIQDARGGMHTPEKLGEVIKLEKSLPVPVEFRPFKPVAPNGNQIGEVIPVE